MTDQELRKLKRTDLLEILLEQSKELDQVKQELEELKASAADREIQIDKAGSIAEAAMSLNGIFEAAQKTADQYLENVERLSRNAEEHYEALEKENQKKIDRALADTERACVEREEKSRKMCDAMQAEAERVLQDAQKNSLHMISETRARCKKMTEEAEQESAKYWDDLAKRMESFYAAHKGLQELLSLHMPSDAKQSEEA